MSDEIVFEEPPKGRNRGPSRVSHAIIAAQLRERPGIWAVIDKRATARSAANTAHAIRIARNMKAYAPAGAYEAMARTVPVLEDGKRVTEYRVYARYVGEKKSDE